MDTCKNVGISIHCVALPIKVCNYNVGDIVALICHEHLTRENLATNCWSFYQVSGIKKKMFHQHFLKTTSMAKAKYITLQFGVGTSGHSRSVTAIWGPFKHQSFWNSHITKGSRYLKWRYESTLQFGCFRGGFSLT